jgi:hypothetical protein
MIRQLLLGIEYKIVFFIHCIHMSTGEKTNDPWDQKKESGVCFVACIHSCFEKDSCFCRGWALGRMARPSCRHSISSVGLDIVLTKKKTKMSSMSDRDSGQPTEVPF